MCENSKGDENNFPNQLQPDEPPATFQRPNAHSTLSQRRCVFAQLRPTTDVETDHPEL
jgi:hypothetical protein